MEAVPSPAQVTRVEDHAPAWSPSRYTTVSMKFLVLYLSSRLSTVNSTSRVGRANAKFVVRRSTMNPTTIAGTGMKPTSRNPAAR